MPYTAALGSAVTALPLVRTTSSESKDMMAQDRTLATSIKRGGDLLAAGVALLLLAPLLAVLAIAIRLESPGPALFKQPRLGRYGSVFLVYKFRSMNDRAWVVGDGLRVTEGDARITRVGRILRQLHLDEIPQLINVVRGEMSLVGPRPTLPFHYDYYEEWERERLEVRPGITGWSQVCGANALNWDRRIELDVWYVQNHSLWLDLKILVSTVVHVCARFAGRTDTYAPPGVKLWTRGFPDDPFTNSLQDRSDP